MLSDFPKEFLDFLDGKEIIVWRTHEYVFMYKGDRRVISNVNEYQEIIDWMNSK